MNLSIIVITRNAPRATEGCLQSLLACQTALAARGEIEFILADDCSLESTNPAPLFPLFRKQAAWPVKALRFRTRIHYAAVMAYAMSLAQASEGKAGDILFVSHDMFLTPACVGELFELAAAQPGFGVFRPRSAKMDFAEKMCLFPPGPIKSIESAAEFAQQVRQQHRGEIVGWPALIGDALLIRREVVERIGVFDTRFYGYWSDVDFGVRVQRAGWRHGIALGAWLHHAGSASGLENFPTGPAAERNRLEMLSDSQTAYELFRAKWGRELLPEKMEDLTSAHYRALRTAPAPEGGEYHPPLALPADAAEWL